MIWPWISLASLICTETWADLFYDSRAHTSFKFLQEIDSWKLKIIADAWDFKCAKLYLYLSVFLSVFGKQCLQSQPIGTFWCEQRLRIVVLANSFWLVLKSGTYIYISLSSFHKCMKLQTPFIKLYTFNQKIGYNEKY